MFLYIRWSHFLHVAAGGEITSENVSPSKSCRTFKIPCTPAAHLMILFASEGRENHFWK